MLHYKLLQAVAIGSLLLINLCCQSSPIPASPETPLSVDVTEIQSVLNNQVNAWNDGDIDTFMETYWRSDSLRFASGGNERRGWEITRQRYLDTYPDAAAMGHLTFEDLDIHRLSPNWAKVFGRYRLQREEALGNLTGLFTLILEKQPAGWVIVHDHTSAAD